MARSLPRRPARGHGTDGGRQPILVAGFPRIDGAESPDRHTGRRMTDPDRDDHGPGGADGRVPPPPSTTPAPGPPPAPVGWILPDPSAATQTRLDLPLVVG